jgi:thiamine-phosphate pyrophosphorylase
VKLYALLDYESLNRNGWTIERFVSTCMSLQAQMIQYRDKKGDRKRKTESLKLIKSLCDITLLINDDLDLVEFCDGLHVGQNDLKKVSICKERAILEIRKKIANKVLGISTHNKEEILEANSFDVDYIGLGAYRATTTKSDATVLKESLSSLARLSSKPVCAIGGVRVDDEIDGVAYGAVGSNLYEY